jgi:hypothetical protein
MPFAWKKVNYLLKIVADLDFLDRNHYVRKIIRFKPGKRNPFFLREGIDRHNRRDGEGNCNQPKASQIFDYMFDENDGEICGVKMADIISAEKILLLEEQKHGILKRDLPTSFLSSAKARPKTDLLRTDSAHATDKSGRTRERYVKQPIYPLSSTTPSTNMIKERGGGESEEFVPNTPDESKSQSEAMQKASTCLNLNEKETPTPSVSNIPSALAQKKMQEKNALASKVKNKNKDSLQQIEKAPKEKHSEQDQVHAIVPKRQDLMRQRKAKHIAKKSSQLKKNREKASSEDWPEDFDPSKDVILTTRGTNSKEEITINELDISNRSHFEPAHWVVSAIRTNENSL